MNGTFLRRCRDWHMPSRRRRGVFRRTSPSASSRRGRRSPGTDLRRTCRRPGVPVGPRPGRAPSTAIDRSLGGTNLEPEFLAAAARIFLELVGLDTHGPTSPERIVIDQTGMLNQFVVRGHDRPRHRGPHLHVPVASPQAEKTLPLLDPAAPRRQFHGLHGPQRRLHQIVGAHNRFLPLTRAQLWFGCTAMSVAKWSPL